MQPSVLLVEDDRDTLELTSELLTLSGFRIAQATSIPQACEQLGRDAFDIVITDFLVESTEPDVAWNGIDELVRAARPTPIGIVTGMRIDQGAVASHRVAFALHKPVSRADLLEAVSRWAPAEALPAEATETMRRYFSFIERGEWEQLGSVCTTNVRYHLPGNDPMYSRLVEGLDEFRRFAAETFAQFPEPRFALTSVRALPAGAIVRYQGSWVDASGKRLGTDGAIFVRFEGALIAELGVRLDLELLRRLSS
ncbi:MAG: nuclear transport factor 2 family protein [Deltaproteobacteria bacterium]|nr:nuclear transport factor 2 family protein [Deltaproteobacteria bacterium]